MGNGASAGVGAAITSSSDDDLRVALQKIPAHERGKLLVAAADEKHTPCAWLCSNGLATEYLRCEFIKKMLRRKAKFDNKDSKMDLAALLAKYGDVLKTLKVLHLNDSLYHRSSESIRESIKTRYMYHWHTELANTMGFDPKNITTIQILEKPWLFNRPGDEGMYDAQAPNIPHEVAEEEEYYAKLKQTQEAYDLLKEDPPKPVPALPSGKSCADELAEISTKLDEKYASALKAWCDKTFHEADVIAGQGGEVVMLNMAYGCCPLFTTKLVEAVRQNHVMYISLSASTMVCCKSMEMTGEIQPGWTEAFSVDKKFLPTDGLMFNRKDLNGSGVECNVLGTLPLFESPMAMRPHYNESWEAEVLKKNLLAEQEYEKETGKLIDDSLVSGSTEGCVQALKLLNIIAEHGAEQDRPVFICMRNDRAIECKYMGQEIWRVV